MLEILRRSKRIESLGDDRYRVVGDLTIRDVTREVALDVVLVSDRVDIDIDVEAVRAAAQNAA